MYISVCRKCNKLSIWYDAFYDRIVLVWSLMSEINVLNIFSQRRCESFRSVFNSIKRKWLNRIETEKKKIENWRCVNESKKGKEEKKKIRQENCMETHTQTEQTLEHKNCPRMKEIYRERYKKRLNEWEVKKWRTVIRILDTNSLFQYSISMPYVWSITEYCCQFLSLRFLNHFITCGFETTSEKLLRSRVTDVSFVYTICRIESNRIELQCNDVQNENISISHKTNLINWHCH